MTAETPLSEQGLSAAPEPWFRWLDGARSPFLNMAVDQALLETAAERGRPILRLYDWDRPAVSIGYVQYAARVERGERVLVRRPTGGGIVYHDHDVTYTVALPPGHWIGREDRIASYHWINRAVQAGLSSLQLPSALSDAAIPRSVDRASMVCFTNPTRYDIMCGTVKIAGSAQRRTRDGLLHQGSINLEHLENVADARAEVRKQLPEGFETVLAARFSPWTPDDAFLSRATELEECRYATRDWNFSR